MIISVLNVIRRTNQETKRTIQTSIKKRNETFYLPEKVLETLNWALWESAEFVCIFSRVTHDVARVTGTVSSFRLTVMVRTQSR